MPTILYNSILVVQIKTTCDSDNEDLKNKEVIEIGTCLLNLQTLRPYEALDLIIKPKKEISEFCTKKTGLMPEDVSSGVSFLDAMRAIKEIYEPSDRPWASYGGFAKHVLKRQCSEQNIPYPFSNRFHDVKSLFAMIFNLTTEVGTKEAIRKLKMVIPEAKDAEDEVLNVSIILSECLRGPSVLDNKFMTKVEMKR